MTFTTLMLDAATEMISTDLKGGWVWTFVKGAVGVTLTWTAMLEVQMAKK